MKNRIMGDEQEWGVVLRGKNVEFGKNFFDRSEEKRMFLCDCLPYSPQIAFLRPQTNINEVWLYNGARAYFDSGQHFEYATPESNGAEEIVECIKAEEIVMERAINRANEILAERGLTLRAYKNNVDSQDNTYGTHENYLALRNEHTEFESLILTLGPHLVTRQLYCGNGRFKNFRAGTMDFFLSQRAQYIMAATGGVTTQERAVINTKDGTEDTYADRKKYRRLHIILGDANIFEAAIFLKYGTTSIVLDMIENGFLLPGRFGNAPGEILSALREFSNDSTLKKACEFGDKKYTLVNVQEILLDLAKVFYSTVEEPTEEKLKIMFRWEQALRLAARSRPQEALRSIADWAGKKLYLEKYADRAKECLAKTPKGQRADEVRIATALAGLDLKFHENSSAGIARQLEEAGDVMTVADKNKVLHLTEHSPQTRAHAREKQMRYFVGLKERINLRYMTEDWDYVSITYGEVTIVVFRLNNPDPFDPNPRLPETDPAPEQEPPTPPPPTENQAAQDPLGMLPNNQGLAD